MVKLVSDRSQNALRRYAWLFLLTARWVPFHTLLVLPASSASFLWLPTRSKGVLVNSWEAKKKNRKLPIRLAGVGLGREKKLPSSECLALWSSGCLLW